MKVIIFGATGSIGSHVVKQALAKGYKIKAFTRHPEKLDGSKIPLLDIYQGDVTNLEDVMKAVKGMDAVLCTLGDGAKGRVRAIGTQNILKSMESLGVRRFICQTTLGLGDSWQSLNFFWKYIMFGFLLKKAFQDHKLQEDFIKESSLDYTIVRPSAFTNEPSNGDFKVGFDAEVKGLSLKISRADVAYFMVNQLDSKKYIKKAISISN